MGSLDEISRKISPGLEKKSEPQREGMRGKRPRAAPKLEGRRRRTQDQGGRPMFDKVDHSRRLATSHMSIEATTWLLTPGRVQHYRGLLWKTLSYNLGRHPDCGSEGRRTVRQEDLLEQATA